MAIRFAGRLGKRNFGKIIIKPLVTTNDDWYLVAVEQQRFEDRGSTNSTTGSTEDWGSIPAAPKTS